MQFTVDVDFAIARPPSPQNIRTHTLTFAWHADDPVGAQLFASQWIAARPGVVMPTATRIVSAVL